tara:strand:- start:1949 stop:2749 length:801 start_codon:yes stop_codon:yes gene_type:complete
MAGKGDKTPSATYGDDLYLDNSNNGLSASLQVVKDGLGDESVLSICDDNLLIKPKDHDTSTAFDVKTSSGTSILTADTANSDIKAGISQTNVLTLFQEFSIADMDCNQGQHHPMAANSFVFTGNIDFGKITDFGTDAEPALTLDFSASSTKEPLVGSYWIVPFNIEIDEVRYITHTQSTGAITTNFWLFWYTLDSSTNHGDLSGGTKLASGSAEPENAKFYTSTLSLESSTAVASGKVLLAFIEEVDDSGGSNGATARIIVKYHIV